MPVKITGKYNFDACPECAADFDDLVEILDDYDGDDVSKYLRDWGYIFTDNSPIDLTLPCGGKVIFVWDCKIGDIRSAECGTV